MASADDALAIRKAVRDARRACPDAAGDLEGFADRAIREAMPFDKVIMILFDVLVSRADAGPSHAWFRRARLGDVLRAGRRRA